MIDSPDYSAFLSTDIVSYAISWLICLPLEIVAASITISYWEGSREVHPAVWVTIFLVMIVRYANLPLSFYYGFSLTDLLVSISSACEATEKRNSSSQ